MSGLYAITPQTDDDFDLQYYAGQVLAGGAKLLQYRDKTSPIAVKLIRARSLLRLCKAYQAKLIINDDVELAFLSQAHGVHLGRDDHDLKLARLRLGSWAIIGASCYADLDRGRRAAAQGADYLAFGSIYPSATKPEAVTCPLEVLTAAKTLGLPIAAIGGITLDKAAAVISAGADMLAVIGDLANAETPDRRAAGYNKLWNKNL